MATRGGNVKVRFGADTSDLERGTRRADSSLDRLGKSGSKSLGHLKTAALGAGVALAGGLVVGTKEAAEAAIESEKANARLRAQLQALGISYGAHEKQIKRVIDAHSQLSGFDDEDLGDSFTNIVRVVGDVDRALRLNTIAMDFARAKHIEVAKAGEIVGKVAGGNTGILSRYGLSADEVTTAQDKLKKSTENASDEQVRAAKESDKQATALAALGVIATKFGGQAESYGKTTAGAVDRSKVAFENLGETVGAHITPIIARVAEGFSELVRQITLGEGPGGRIRSVLEGIGSSALSVGNTIRGLVTGFQEGSAGARLLAAALGGAAAAFVAFKVVATVTAAVTALRAAWIGLTAAIAANPIGAVAIGITAVVGALGILSIRTKEATVSTQAFTDALRAQKLAMREIEDIDIETAQRRANVKSATVALEQAEGRLKDLRKSGTASAVDLKQAEADVAQSKVAVTRANRELSRSEEDNADTKRRGAEATKVTRGEEDKLNASVDAAIAGKRKEIAGYEDSIREVKQYGGNLATTRKTVEALRGKQEELREEIGRLSSKRVTVSVRLDFNAAMNASPGSDAAQGDGWGGPGITQRVVAGVKANASRLFFSSFGGPLTGAFGGMAGLMGARPQLGPFAALGSRFGLGVTSGRRPGSITNAGNVSWHSSGEAIDVAGSPGGMLAYARALAAMFGGRLAELIHTPLGFSIKGGQRVAPFAQADHFDHVHVAMDTGRPGIGDGWGRRPRTGDGLGRFDSTAYGPPWNAMNGTGVTATGVNLKPARKAYGVAVDPDVIPLGTRLRITPNPFGYGGFFTAFDTGGAIQGKRIDFYDWRGRAAQLGWGHREVSVSTTDGAGGSRGGSRRGRQGSPVGGSVGTPSAGLPPGTSRGGFIAGSIGFEGDLAAVGVRKATAEKRDDLSGLIGALEDERAIKRRRLKRIRKVLKGRLGVKRRTRLLQEEAQLIGEIGDLTGTIKEYKADQAGGAQTITRAEELEAGVDTSADTDTGAGSDAGGGAGPDPALELSNRLAEDHNALLREQTANQQKILQLAQQGPAILAAVIAAVNGDIGGRTGLGFQTVGYPGATARY